MRLHARPFGALRGGEGVRYALRVCVALLHDHRTAGAGVRCAGLPVPGIGYCETCGGYPTPFFRRCVCERRILSASCRGCRAGALCPGCRSCYALIGCVYIPDQWALHAVCALYGYCAMCYPLPPYMPPYARIYTGVAVAPYMAAISYYLPYMPPICVYT